ncbi:MAG: hypothetical protein K0U86_07455 [Planctomycetes bacterium]|nr:hypothetical protein [Planctomycetota bacterium]MCH9724724.1 hypothetical protein [Planctomycetota bacterium]MCH9778830.1 hypothetical protein [Planctomycetota bacterium]MCH9790423.1 hypothetical protein [Planctomycetota bacterium]
MSVTIEEFEPEEPEAIPEIEKKIRSRFRVVLVHVLKSCVFLPFPIKYLLFAFIAIAKPPLAAAVVLWAVGSVAFYVFSLRRSLSSIRKKVTVVNPEGCILPSIIGFGLFAFFNLFIDLALATNSGTKAGPLMLLSVLLIFCVFAYQSLMTQRGFAAMTDTDSKLPIRVFGILVAAGDLAIVVGFVTFIVAAINGAF